MATAPGPTWQVTDQTQTIDLDKMGKAVKGMRVYFTTSQGVQASVFIPQDRYNADTVKAAITEAYAHISAVHKLTG